jgi:hypothetical protein
MSWSYTKIKYNANQGGGLLSEDWDFSHIWVTLA